MEAGLDAVDMGPTCDVTKSPSVGDASSTNSTRRVRLPLGDDATGNGARAAPYATLGTAIKAAVSRSLRVTLATKAADMPSRSSSRRA